MNHVVLFHGTAGWTVAIIALIGWIEFVRLLAEWPGDRLALTRRPLRIARRAVAPGTWVRLPDGSYGRILYLFRDRDFAEPWAAVQPHDDDQQALPAVMMASSSLSAIEYEEAVAP